MTGDEPKVEVFSVSTAAVELYDAAFVDLDSFSVVEDDTLFEVKEYYTRSVHYT
jgi:hypothetical protein